MKKFLLIVILIIFLFGCTETTTTPNAPTQIESFSTQEIKTTHPDLRVINPENIKALEELDTWGESIVYDIAISPDKQTIAVRTLEGIHFYDSQTLEQTGFRPYPIKYTYYRELAMSYSPDGKYLILGDGAYARFVNLETWESDKIITPPFPDASISNVDVTADGKHAVIIMNAGSSYCDGTGTNIAILNIERERSRQIYSSYFCHPGDVYYKVTTNNSVYIWVNSLLDSFEVLEVVDLESERLIERIQYRSTDANTSEIYDVSLDGSLFAIKTNSSEDPYTEIVDVKTNITLQRIKGYISFTDNLNGKTEWKSVSYPHTEQINPNCGGETKRLAFNPKTTHYPDEIKHNEQNSTIITFSTIDLWNTKRCEIIKQIPIVFSASYLSGIFSPDGKLFAKQWGKYIKVWDAETGELRYTLQTSYYPNSLFTFIFNNAGDQLVSIGEIYNYNNSQTSEKRILLVWDSLAGKLLNEIEISREHAFNKIVPSLDSNVIVVHNSTLDFYNISTGEKISSIPNGLFAFENDNQVWVISERDTDSISLYDILNGKVLKTIPFSTDYVYDFILSEDKTKLTLLTSKNKLVFADLKGLKVTGEIIMPDFHSSLIENGDLFFSYGYRSTIQIWDFNSNFIREFNGFSLIDTRRNIDDNNGFPFYGNNKVVISPNQQVLAVLNDVYNEIQFWDINSGILIGEVRPSIYYIRDISFSPDGHLFVVEGGDGYIYVWGVKSP